MSDSTAAGRVRFTAPGAESDSDAAGALAMAGDRAAGEGRRAEALRYFDAVRARFGDSPDPGVARWIVWAAARQADVFAELGQEPRAMSLRDELIRRWADHDDPYVRSRVASALDMKARGLRRLGRWRDELGVREEQLALFGRPGDEGEPEVLRWQAFALLESSRAHLELGDGAAALTQVDALVKRFGDSSDEDLQRYVAESLVLKFNAVLDDPVQRARADDELLQRFANTTNETLWPNVAHALYRRARAADARHDASEALRLYEAVVTRARGADDLDLSSVRTNASLRAAEILNYMRVSSHGLALLDAEIGELRKAADPRNAELLGRALLGRVALLRTAGRAAEAVVVASAVTEEFGGSSRPERRKIVARALIDEATALAELGRLDESEEVVATLLKEYADDALAQLDDVASHPDAAHQPGIVASAMLMKAHLLEGLGRQHESDTVLTELLTRFSRVEDPTVARIVATARELGEP